MRKGQLKNVSYLKQNRQLLRNNQTPAESYLWKHLQRSQLQGRKFRRQFSIGNFIADFCCPAEKLVVELDGEVHNNPIQSDKDLNRDEYLGQLGYTIIRFENKQVFEQTDAVLEAIAAHFSK